MSKKKRSKGERLERAVGVLNWMKDYRKEEIIKDEFAYDRLLAWVHETARCGLFTCDHEQHR